MYQSHILLPKIHLSSSIILSSEVVKFLNLNFKSRKSCLIMAKKEKKEKKDKKEKKPKKEKKAKKGLF